jgi:CRP-like cAMP-binding protein
MNHDVAKVFFDTFSNRLGLVESALKILAVEVEDLKVTGDQTKLSDLVLLERQQKAEKLLNESLNWIKQIADTILSGTFSLAKQDVPAEELENEPSKPVVAPLVQASHNDPTILQPGSLNSLTTPTELQVLTLLASEGPKSAPEIGKHVGRSREHTARLMKKLFDEGYVRRDQTRIPFRYSTVERVKKGFTRPEAKDRVEEAASAPPV